VHENLPWIEYTFAKMGNQISLKAQGYQKINKNHAILYLNVTNNGLSD
jgi:hypothetical protein